MSYASAAPAVQALPGFLVLFVEDLGKTILLFSGWSVFYLMGGTRRQKCCRARLSYLSARIRQVPQDVDTTAAQKGWSSCIFRFIASCNTR